jgi:starch phosphorylase
VTAWLERMSSSWDKIAITDVEVPEMGPTLFVGQKFSITIKVFLGNITPDDVRVEVVSGKLNSQEQILDYIPLAASLAANPHQDGATDNGTYIFTGEVICNESGRFGITARIVPKNENLPHTLKPKLISWW